MASYLNLMSRLWYVLLLVEGPKSRMVSRAGGRAPAGSCDLPALAGDWTYTQSPLEGSTRSCS